MKGLIYGLIGVILILLASYGAISYEGNSGSYGLKTFVIEGGKENTEMGYSNLNVFVIGQEPSGRDMLIRAKRETKCTRERNLKYQQMEEEIDRCIEKITKNWKRTYYRRSYEKVYDDEEGEWVTTNVFWEREREFWGYDGDEDFRLRWRLRNKAIRGEKVC